MPRIDLESALEAARLEIAVERFEWRHLWKLRLLRMVTNAGGGFVFGVALGLAALVQVLHCAAGQV